ncbi:MAG TPA: HAMP domain-containing protein [Anaeromyxobacter sp.]|nr:HAMP domain-containing protein [Anaeromyxobacter sp.]
MRLRTRLLLLPAVTLAAFVAVEGLSRSRARESDQLLQEVERSHVPELELAHDLDALLARTQQAFQDAVAARDVRAVKATGALHDAFLRCLEEARSIPGVDAAGLETLERGFRAYYEVAAASAAEQAAGRAASADVEVLVQYDEIRQAVDAASVRARRALQAGLQGAAEAQRAGRRATSGAIGIAALLVAVLAAWIFFGLVGPLAALTRVASRIATQGDLSQEVQVTGDDELGQLARSFREMVERLREVPRTIEASVVSVSGAARAVGEVTAAQARAQEQQAHTVAHARRLAAGVRRAGVDAIGRAEQVLTVAADAEEYGRRGQQDARAGLLALAAIRDEMRAAVRGIEKLDEHVQRASAQLDALRSAAGAIGDVASGLSVEAARGGPGELAELIARLRRAQATVVQNTARARAVLDDARRAAGATLRADRDEGRVDKALAQVEAYGTILRELLRRLQRTGKAAREIVETVASQEKGIVEVDAAIAGVDTLMTEALRHVAQAVAAARALEQDASRLAGVVASFRL